CLGPLEWHLVTGGLAEDRPPRFQRLRPRHRWALPQERVSAGAGHGDVGIAVGDERDVTGGFEEAVRVFLGEVLQIGDGRVLLEDHLAVAVRKDLQGVPLADPEGSADLLGYHDAAEVVDASYNACRLHGPDTSCS